MAAGRKDMLIRTSNASAPLMLGDNKRVKGSKFYRFRCSNCKSSLNTHLSHCQLVQLKNRVERRVYSRWSDIPQYMRFVTCADFMLLNNIASLFQLTSKFPRVRSNQQSMQIMKLILHNYVTCLQCGHKSSDYLLMTKKYMYIFINTNNKCCSKRTRGSAAGKCEVDQRPWV